ncbi:hypothetical protein [Streptomyces olivaceoviridis]|uniref:hypothetical protein n=1 Tax=Streptomyces olivaceoviridis TaxID=1921 RepID=UPI00368B64C1
MEETFRSFAPGGVPVVGSGFGALTAIALKAKFPHSAGRLVLVDTLPGAPSPGQLCPKERLAIPTGHPYRGPTTSDTWSSNASAWSAACR